MEVANANRDVIVGIKVRVGRIASGNSGIVPLDIALQVAEEAGIPLMCHIDHPPPSYEEVLAAPAARRCAHPCLPARSPIRRQPTRAR